MSISTVQRIERVSADLKIIFKRYRLLRNIIDTTEIPEAYIKATSENHYLKKHLKNIQSSLDLTLLNRK